MKTRIFYEVIIEKENQLESDLLSMGIEETLKDIEGVESVMITVEEDITIEEAE